MGILTPCFTVAFSLFCVTMRGFESSLPTPLASAAVMKKSTAKLEDRFENPKPLVGTPAPRLRLRGRPPELALLSFGVTTGVARTGALGVVVPLVPSAEGPWLTPTCGEPENSDRPPATV